MCSSLWLPAVPSKLRTLLAWPAVGVSVKGTGVWGGICDVPGQIRSTAEPELTPGDSRKSAACKPRVTSLPWPSAANALCWKWKVLLALPKGWDGEGMIHLAKLVPVPSGSSPAPRTWPRVLLCALCCPGACSARVPSAPDPVPSAPDLVPSAPDPCSLLGVGVLPLQLLSGGTSV